jgi:hypothetical protein
MTTYCQSTFAPEAFTTFSYFASSAFMKLRILQANSPPALPANWQFGSWFQATVGRHKHLIEFVRVAFFIGDQVFGS